MSKQQSSYRQIIKSTGIFGGVQVVNIILGIIRQKAIALLLGLEGLGLISSFQSIVDFVRSLSTLGIDTAGVKDIAASIDDSKRLSRKVAVFRWWVVLTSCFGALICLVFCYPISLIAFQNPIYAIHIALLSLCVLFTSISTGQYVIMQGTRNIAFMAKSTLWGNAIGLLVSLLLYYCLGVKGIIPAFISGAFILVVVSSYFARKINIEKVQIKNTDAFQQGLKTLKLGTFIVSVSIMESASMLIIKSFLTHKSGIEAVGIFQPAWSITIIYLSLILKSMGSDFFPRLCSISENLSKVRKLVNEQTHIALIIATPAVIVMMMFSNQILSLLYSSEFIAGTSLLRWHIAGSFFKVISWPIAFILLAKGNGKYYLISEFFYFAAYLGFSFLLFPYLGINAVGVAYLAAYIIYLASVLMYVAKKHRFKWSVQNIKTGAISFILIMITVSVLIYLPNYQILFGILLGGISAFVSLYMLNKVYSLGALLNKIKDRISPRK